MRLRPLLPVLVLLATLACGSSTGIDDDDGLNVLLVGNSFTYWNDLPAILTSLLRAGGVEPVTVEAVAFPNYGLEDHWNEGSALARIAEGGWDVVGFQQGASATEGRPSLLEYAPRFADSIRAAGAEPAVYMVWPAEARSFEFDLVSASHRMAADRADALLFPVGDAWVEAWARDETLDLYDSDRFHPAPGGSYLAALVMYAVITGESPVGLPAGAGGVAVPEGTARILQEAAQAAVAAGAANPAR